jgi:hypothetical protein
MATGGSGGCGGRSRSQAVRTNRPLLRSRTTSCARPRCSPEVKLLLQVLGVRKQKPTNRRPTGDEAAFALAGRCRSCFRAFQQARLGGRDARGGSKCCRFRPSAAQAPVARSRTSGICPSRSKASSSRLCPARAISPPIPSKVTSPATSRTARWSTRQRQTPADASPPLGRGRRRVAVRDADVCSSVNQG